MAEQVDLEVGRLALRTFRLWTFGSFRRPRPRAMLIPMGQTGALWEEGTCTAQCLRATMAGGKDGKYHTSFGETYEDDQHEAPDLGCNCGIYGSLTYDSLRRQYHSHLDGIVTVMAAEGKTVIGSMGLRTQFARIVGYYAQDPRHAQVAEYQFPDAKEYPDLFSLLDANGFPSPTYGPLAKDTWPGWTT